MSSVLLAHRVLGHDGDVDGRIRLDIEPGQGFKLDTTLLKTPTSTDSHLPISIGRVDGSRRGASSDDTIT